MARRVSSAASLPPIENTTKIRGDDLVRLVSACLANARRVSDVIYPIKIIKFVESQDFYSSGHAICEIGEVEISVARGFAGRRWEVREIAQLLEHETDHMCGAEHPTMLPWWDLSPVWAQRLRLRVKEKPTTLERQLRALTFDLSVIETGGTPRR